MHLDFFSLETMGPIRDVRLPLDRRFNVIAGVNGVGKSTILRAMSLMLGRYTSVVRTGKAAGSFDRSFIRRGAAQLQAIAIANTSDEEWSSTVEWRAGIARPGRRPGELTESRQLIEFGLSRADAVERFPASASLPISVMYTVNRAVLDVPLRVRKKAPFGQYAALDDALGRAGSSFRTFFTWFREREDLENERRLEVGDTRDPQLTAVRRAIAGMLPGYENVRVKRSPLRMVITKQGLELAINELSDGEKCLLAMIGDLARRLAIANPGSDDPLSGSAIVLIDELELHLHPRWQRETVKRLLDTFPKSQFIVSSHSPQVLSEVKPEGIFLLDNGQVTRPNRSRGWDVNLILKELMSAPDRSDLSNDAIKQLYDAIDDSEFGAAQQRLRNLEEELGVDYPDLTAARATLTALGRR